MSNKLIGWDDTIVALATAPAVSAIGVVRISGKDSFSIVDALFPSKELGKQASHTLHVGILKDGGVPIDEVVLQACRANKRISPGTRKKFLKAFM